MLRSLDLHSFPAYKPEVFASLLRHVSDSRHCGHANNVLGPPTVVPHVSVQKSCTSSILT